MAKLLLDRGANIEEQSRESNATPLHIASSEGETQVLKLLLDRGANVNSTMKDERTPLHEASCSDVAELLIKYGADVEAESRDGMPLHVAAIEGKTEVLNLLLERGAKLEARNNMNRTPLHEAAGHGLHKETDLLIRFGADIYATSHVGTPIDFARNNGHEDFALWLEQVAELKKDKFTEITHFTSRYEEYKNKLKKMLEEIIAPSVSNILFFNPKVNIIEGDVNPGEFALSL